jgi:metallo-beta-lactamase family protein
MEIDTPGRIYRLLFSGDLGRYDVKFMDPPEKVDLPDGLDLLCIESTYGDRHHEDIDPRDWLEKHIRDAHQQKRVILVPAFALGRTQQLLYLIEELERTKRIPAMPVYLDSPMASDITHLYARYEEEHNAEIARILGQSAGVRGWKSLHVTSTVGDSKDLNNVKGPALIIAASGMMTGGRILHHLVNRLPDPLTKILLVGFQAEGTRGWSLLNGAKELKIFGEQIPVRAEIDHLDAFSGHGDQGDLINYLRILNVVPRNLVLVHGEIASLTGLEKAVADQLALKAHIARRGELLEL